MFGRLERHVAPLPLRWEKALALIRGAVGTKEVQARSNAETVTSRARRPPARRHYDSAVSQCSFNALRERAEQANVPLRNLEIAGPQFENATPVMLLRWSEKQWR